MTINYNGMMGYKVSSTHSYGRGVGTVQLGLLIPMFSGMW